MRAVGAGSLIVNSMWNCSAPSPLLPPFGDDYVKCESSNPAAGASGFDKIRLPTDYDIQLSFSPSFQSLQTQPFFAARSSESYFGIGENSIYNEPAFTQFSYSVPATPTNHLVRWTATGEATAGDGSSFRGSKRLKTATTAATTQGPHLRPQCSAKPRNQAIKGPCKRSQKLGDKITALQQLVSPYGKTDTASVLHEAAACIRSLHEQIQILAAPYPAISFSAASQDIEDDEPATAGLRRRGLCLAPLSPAVVRLVTRAGPGGRRADMEEDGWFGAP